MKKLFCATFLFLAGAVHAYDLTAEVNEGRHGEVQFRFGPTFKLTDHWNLDTGVSFVKYQNFHDGVGLVDATLARRFNTQHMYFDVGTGLALWTEKKFDLQNSATLWTFSNRFGAGYKLNKNTEIGVDYRHYSNLCFSPNTSKDFLGLHVGIKF